MYISVNSNDFTLWPFDLSLFAGNLGATGE